MTTQPFALVGVGGYPDGVWTCAWCAAELADGKIRHREDCAWLAEICAAERERIAKLAEKHNAHYGCYVGITTGTVTGVAGPGGGETTVTSGLRLFAALIREEGTT